LREKIFKNIWVQPAAGDAGGALGAALAVWHMHYDNDRKISISNDSMQGSYLGPSFSNSKIEEELKLSGAVFKKCSENELVEEVATALLEILDQQ
jgi:carbamoyltransferase